MECAVCLNEKAKDCFPEIQTCHHRCCSKCLKQYFKIEIMESRVSIACPECSELFHPNDIRAVVEDDYLMQKYEDFMLRRVLAMDSDTRWCPAPDCGFAVIAAGCAGCPKLKCEREGCDTYFCYHCKQYWHPNQTCDAARAERSPNIRSASVSYSQGSGGQNEIKPCPRCGAFIVKMNDGSCNHMTCAVCGAGFCWLCMKEVSDLHYLSPSGCTFWGRKPWSRKKKILWQLGTLVGAPVGITLVAGIAVPAMIIGIPIWVGRKIQIRYELASKHKRHLAFAGGVTASVLAAPIIASIVVGIGVPILLAYVYGVVPISLCRSGGCGVTTTNSGGVRFEFDEENDTNTQGPYIYGGDSHSLETAPNVANPSIAPSIGDTSLGMTNSLSASGSHMDRAGVLRDDSDRDSSSHRAIAGTSINGSLCSASYTAQHHKLEVHADISEHGILSEKSSMGGESYNISLNDDASTRALAGSIISPKDKDGVSLCSRHFDGATSAAPLVYPEEVEESVSTCSGGQQRHGSSSCPTSPNLRKASPAPSEDKNSRGKKCTRFMDQVSEIETSKCDSKSAGSILIQSNAPSHSEDQVNISTAPAPTLSTLSLASAPPVTLPPVLTSCSSLACEEERPVVTDPSLRMKAESTSVLMDGADSRRCEMGGSRQQQDGCRFKDKDGQGVRSWLGSKKNGKSSDKEHRSQPGNLSDISEMKGMPCNHATGCDNLLAVLDASCEHMFLDKGGQTRARCTSASSSSSSIETAPELPPRRCGSLRKYYTDTEGEAQCTGGLKEHFHSDYGLDRVREEAAGNGACSHLSRMSRQREWCGSERCLVHGSKLSKLSVCSPISEDNIYDGDNDDQNEIVSSRDLFFTEGCASKDLSHSVSLGNNHLINGAYLPEVEVPSINGHSCFHLSSKSEIETTCCSLNAIHHHTPATQQAGTGMDSSSAPSLSTNSNSKNSFVQSCSRVQRHNAGTDDSMPKSHAHGQQRGNVEGAGISIGESETEDIPPIAGISMSSKVLQDVYVTEQIPSRDAWERDVVIRHTRNADQCEADFHHSSVL